MGLTVFDYENYKKLKPMIEERDGSYAWVQAWALEYYEALMEDLLAEYESLIETPSLNLQPYTQGKIDILKAILFENDS